MSESLRDLVERGERDQALGGAGGADAEVGEDGCQGFEPLAGVHGAPLGAAGLPLRCGNCGGFHRMGAEVRPGWEDGAMLAGPSRLDRITVNPEISHGKPTIRGMRIRVRDVLELLASGMTYEEILADYDELERDDILAVLEFAALDSAGRIERFVA